MWKRLKQLCSLIWFLSMALASDLAGALEFTVSERAVGGGIEVKLAVLSGEIVKGDGLRFRQLLEVHPDIDGVVLTSPGGSLLDGMRIGETIREYGLPVQSDGICASSCALIWLAGKERYASRTSRVCFHASYVIENDKKEVTAVGNALVGKYVGNLGFDDNVVVFATTASPEAVQCLDATTARRLRIDVALVGDVNEFAKVSAKRLANLRPPTSPLLEGERFTDDTIRHSKGGCAARAEFNSTLEHFRKSFNARLNAERSALGIKELQRSKFLERSASDLADEMFAATKIGTPVTDIAADEKLRRTSYCKTSIESASAQGLYKQASALFGVWYTASTIRRSMMHVSIVEYGLGMNCPAESNNAIAPGSLGELIGTRKAVRNSTNATAIYVLLLANRC